MKPVIRTPYFEVGTKNYVYGDKLLEYARAADAAAEKYDIDVLFICPALEVRRVAENTKHLFVLATYMDTLRPGRGCPDILPEGLKAAGAVGVMINHCEKPMSLPQMKKTIDRARELDFLVFACADTLDEAKAIAQLHPDIINPEPSEIIGGGKGASPMAYVRDSIKVIKEIRGITGLGLAESKAMVEAVPAKVKEGISKEDAEALKAQLEAVGATVEIK